MATVRTKVNVVRRVERKKCILRGRQGKARLCDRLKWDEGGRWKE